METKNLADLYDLPLLEWGPVETQLGPALTQAPGTGGPDRHTCWLSTVNPDGSPHVTGVGAFWDDGAFWVVTGKSTRKGRNLLAEPRCAMSVSTSDYDLCVEGSAELVTDTAKVARIVAVAADGGWPAEVDASGIAVTAPYSAPSAGPPPWSVFRIEPKSATALSVHEPGGATRWTF
ncbi:Pyridoxamine 5'-phosphate oxidase [Pedococcus dokdonensis]|uniref:Pyridoxamine 5'-phosphate oxidase n=1 Tax=Pedococcus dokdonensis TaxID=443156 RepID=A0A1H0RZR8_9MICO|nr:pyridoxamine 5'-phosphate oxidase family protein [Pedococcus dokdonensis]SDP34506.1 Pyridoxamine 5'-phosphate oxidase [Pedococcus dokdonensis]